jgi:hypothetical protein
MASNQFVDHGPGPGPDHDHDLIQANNPAFSPRTERSQLGVHFQPCDYSVICGRGKASSNHTGNRRFRVIAGMFVEKYSMTGCNKHKSTMAANIVAMTRERGGSFCKYEQGAWFEVGDRCAREKVSTFFRDRLHNDYRSSAKAKTALRRARAAKQNETKTEQNGQQLLDDTGHSDDSSMSSSCSGISTDSLGFEHSVELDFFDIDVF